MTPSHCITYRGITIRFFWIDGKYWVPAPDLCKALGYSRTVNEPTKQLPSIDENMDVSAHRLIFPIPRWTWLYDQNGVEFAFWPRLRMYSQRKAELKPLLIDVLKRKTPDDS